MNEGSVATLFIIALLLLIVWVLALRERRRQRRVFLSNIRRQWGKENRYTIDPEREESIPHYYRHLEKASAESEGFRLDDISWNDCDLDAVRRTIDRSVSSPGAEVLYAWLRQPLFSAEAVAERDSLISLFENDQALRESVQVSLSEVGFLRRGSYFDHLSHLLSAQKIRTGSCIALACLSLANLILFFFLPLAAVWMLILTVGLNVWFYFKERDRIKMHSGSLAAFQSLMRCGRQLLKTEEAQLSARRAHLADILHQLRRVRGTAFLGGGIQTDLLSVFIEYLNLFFHIDQLRFNQILGDLQEKEEACLALFSEIGEWDAAISCAAYRAALPKYCRGELSEAAEAFVSVCEMRHPLLPDGVPNDCELKGGNLVTGSNASGKSTFLKGVALSAVLAQTVITVPARSYRASFLRVYTSMALRDAIEDGESYFIVEIKSIKRIMDAEKRPGAPILAVVDEVLRGTNTVERISASAQILQSLCGGAMLILAATHDLELTRLLEENYRNLHFSEEIDGQDVCFSFKLQEGPATTRNAIYLLSRAGYDSSVVAAAQAMAEEFEQSGKWKMIRGEG